MIGGPIASMPVTGIWQRIWLFLQAAEMSAGEYQFDRTDALERRVAALEAAQRAHAPAPSDHR